MANKIAAGNTLKFVYPPTLNTVVYSMDQSYADTELQNINFMMFFGMHLNNEKNSNTVICLPIPTSGLEDKLKANWSVSESSFLNSIAETAVKVTNDQSLESAANNVATIVTKAAGTAIKPLKMAVEDYDKFAGRAKMDTNIPVFSQMDNRGHTFAWTFTPTSKEEAVLITAICNAFKIGTLPHFRPGQIVQSYPPRWNIKTRYSRYTLDFKTSVLTECNVKYGSGSYNEFQISDNNSEYYGIPTKIELSLGFTEIAKPNTLLITDPNRQRTDTGDSVTKGATDKWARTKEVSNKAEFSQNSVNNLVATGFRDADTFSGNFENLD